MVNGWIVFATFNNSGWTVDLTSDRWVGRQVEGLTEFDGRLWVLLKGPQGRELWRFSGSWESELIPQLDPVWGISSLAMNQSTLFVAGVDATNRPIVMERKRGTTAFTVHGLNGPGGPATEVMLAVPKSGTPRVSWTTGPLLPTAATPLFHLYTAFRATDWETRGEPLPDQMRFRTVSDGTQAFLLSTLSSGQEVLYQWNNSTSDWRRCSTEIPPAASLHPSVAETWIGGFDAGASVETLECF